MRQVQVTRRRVRRPDADVEPCAADRPPAALRRLDAEVRATLVRIDAVLAALAG